MSAPQKPSESGSGASESRRDLSALRMDHEKVSRRSRRGALLPRLGIVIVVIVLFLVAVRPPRSWLSWLPPVVETTTVQELTPTQASTVLTATGYTYARARAAVGAKIIGRIVELNVDEGDRVAAGDVIAVLDSLDLEASVRQAEAGLLEAQAQLADAERESGRAQRLLEAGITSQAAADATATRLEVTRAQVKTAEARLESMRAQLEYTVIRAPISGVVIERSVEVGEMVAPGGFTTQQSTGSIVRIADPASLEVEADINESYIARLKLGQPAAVRVDAVPDHDYHGSLRQIVPTADRQRAVVEVKVRLHDADFRLVPDMSCSVTFLEEGVGKEELEAKPRLLVPRDTVEQPTDQPTHLWRLKQDRVEKVTVELGEVEGNLVEVLSGVSGGEVVVRNPAGRLVAGQKIRKK